LYSIVSGHSESAIAIWRLQAGEEDMDQSIAAWRNGLLGVVIFSGSLPATRVAVADFSPMFLTSARAVIAAALGALFLVSLRQPMPQRKDVFSLALVALGVVVGFPLLTALALQHVTSAHAIAFIGLIPLATAIFGVLRGEARPRAPFWLFSVLGAATVAGFAAYGADAGTFVGDAFMVAATIVCGLGYAEGAGLSRRFGGWQVISWALLLSLPIMSAIALWAWPVTWTHIGAPAWIGLAYVSIFSMLIGFFFWYRGLAVGGVGVGQLQLLQPFFGFLLSSVFLGEPVTGTMIAAAAIVMACVAATKRFV
jgi:drug/metabolite transporter (DMT)-like permease